MTPTEIQFFSAVETGQLDQVRFLLEQNPQLIYATSPQGTTCLMVATKSEQLEMVKFLVTQGADVNQADKSGRSPLLSAIHGKKWHASGNFEIVKFLVENGAEVNKKEQDISPLWLSVAKGRLDLVELLIRKGANINSKDDHNEYDELIPLITAASCGFVEIVQFLVKNGALINIRSKSGWTPLTASLQFPPLTNPNYG